MNLVIGDLYRRKATQETRSGGAAGAPRRRSTRYDEVLKTDATNERALAESAAVRAATRNE